MRGMMQKDAGSNPVSASWRLEKLPVRPDENVFMNLLESEKIKTAKREGWVPSFICIAQDKVGLKPHYT